ncbi:MAG TPA: transglutaminase-like domain-containing protein, partial [Spirochaetota bacterium]|nr:transglutaminase-like domain-containing protein [Spirochaetota bacterium]
SRKFFDCTDRVLFSTSRVVTQLKTPLNWKIYNSQEKCKVINDKNESSYLFSISGLSPVKPEENSLPYTDRIPSVAFSSFSDWKEFNKWYCDLIDDKTVMNDEMKRKADELTRGVSDEEKIRRIYEYITKRIRYVGFELGAGSIVPRSTDSVYHSSLGDCKDTALLLSAFYEYCGFDSRLALLRTNNSSHADLDFPYVGAFNHAICYVNYKGGLFLDGTVDRADIYELPDNDRSVSAFIVSKKGHSIKYIDPAVYNKNLDKVTNKVKIFPNGDAEFTRLLYKTGSLALYSRESFDIEKKKRSEIEEYWRNEYAGSSINSFSVAEKSPGKPLQYSYGGFLREFAGN